MREKLRVAHRLARRCAVFARQAGDCLLGEGLQLGVARHLGLRDAAIKQAKPVEHRIMQLRFDMRQAFEEIAKVLAPRHVMAPMVEPLPRFRVEALRPHIAPKWRVVALGRVMQIDEAAEIIELAPDALIIIGALGRGHRGRRFHKFLTEQHHLHNGAMDRGGFQRL